MTNNDRFQNCGVFQAISSVKRNGCAIKGNIETKVRKLEPPIHFLLYNVLRFQMNRPDIKSRNVEMRNELDLFVNVINCKSQPGIKTRHDNIDIVLIRQNTEGTCESKSNESVQLTS